MKEKKYMAKSLGNSVVPSLNPAHQKTVLSEEFIDENRLDCVFVLHSHKTFRDERRIFPSDEEILLGFNILPTTKSFSGYVMGYRTKRAMVFSRREWWCPMDMGMYEEGLQACFDFYQNIENHKKWCVFGPKVALETEKTVIFYE